MSAPLVLLFFCCLQSFWVSTIGDSINPRIIGGQVASIGQFPYVVGYYYQREEVRNFCGGALTTNRLILTAAHCIANANNFTIYLGTTTREPTSPGGLILSSTEYVAHPEYNPSNLANDIGFIILEEPVEFTDNIQSIELATSTLRESEAVTAIGWGTTSSGQTVASNTLHHVSLETISNLQCMSVFASIISDAMVCAVGPTTEGTCTGDAGGPLVQVVSGKPLHVGVSIFFSGRGCDYGDPSGFARTLHYTDWIQNITDAYSSDSAHVILSPLIIILTLIHIMYY